MNNTMALWVNWMGQHQAIASLCLYNVRTKYQSRQSRGYASSQEREKKGTVEK